MELLPAFAGVPQAGQVYHVDALALLRALPDASVDAVICDPPYNVVNIAWDVKLDLPALWEQLKRVIKPDGAIVMTAVQPFAARLIMSNLPMYRYEWVIEKTMATGFLNTKHRPLRAHELAEVFSFAAATAGSNGGVLKMQYYPQMTAGAPYMKRGRSGVYEGYNSKQRIPTKNDGWRYPRSVIRVNNSNAGSEHPTQKPVELMAYFIRTYTQPGALVVDPFVGSGTTAVAAFQCGRQFIAGDTCLEYVETARRRLRQTTPDMFATFGAA